MIRYIFSSKRERIEFSKVEDIVPKGKISMIDDGLPRNEDAVWVHIGYCSGEGLGVGVLVEPTHAYNSETGEMIRIDSIFPVERRICVTRKDENKKVRMNCPVVYDDGLFRIAEIPHKRLHAIKMVSRGADGGVNHGKDGMWIRMADMLSRYLKE